MKTLINQALTEYIDSRLSEFDLIDAERREHLNALAIHIAKCKESANCANLIFICRCNSRRSHFAQIWAQIAADYFDLNSIKSFSGGIKTSAFNPKVISALERTGLEIFKLDETDNPTYSVYYSQSIKPIRCFSKIYFHEFNPSTRYTTVVICKEPELDWPSLEGATKTFNLTYQDPKEFDSTPLEIKKHDDVCKQISCEMLYMFYILSKL